MQRTLICVAVVFTFTFTLHYSLHVAAALLYVSFQDADFFCRDVVRHNLLVTVFLSRCLAQLKLKMTSVFLVWTLKKKKTPPASMFVARTYFLSSTTEIPDFLDVLGVSRVMTDIWEPKKKASANPKAWRNGNMKCVLRCMKRSEIPSIWFQPAICSGLLFLIHRWNMPWLSRY